LQRRPKVCTRFDSGCATSNCFISSGIFFQSTRVLSFLSRLIWAGNSALDFVFLRSSRIHIIDTKPNPWRPNLVKVIDPKTVVSRVFLGGFSRHQPGHGLVV
jgi:hypothetical protein